MRLQGWILCALLVVSCGPAAQETNTRPVESQEQIETLSICQAARRAAGARVRIAAEFDGFGYETGSRRVTLQSGELCSERGAGLAFAVLRSDAERRKLFSTRPGTPISVEGTIERVEQGRFVHLQDGVVASTG